MSPRRFRWSPLILDGQPFLFAVTIAIPEEHTMPAAKESTAEAALTGSKFQSPPPGKNDPDPNNYREAKTAEEIGFVKNPVAGGAIPHSTFTSDYVNGVDHEDDES